jgi:transcriptional regulator with XRE-family HTH domain
LVLPKHAKTARLSAMNNQRPSTDFNKRVGANLQLIRKAAGWSQADLADQLSRRGLPFHQPTILKIEKGTRPLRFEEAFEIANALGVNVASLCQPADSEPMAEAAAKLQRISLTIARTERGIEETRRNAEKSIEDTRTWLKQVMQAAKAEAEQELRDSGAVQDQEGTWRTRDGKALIIAGAGE